MKKILVVGVGTAGIITLGQMASSLDDNWEIHSVYDPNIPILGVGEATSTNAPLAFFKGLGFNMAYDAERLSATFKYGVRYTNWREHTFDSLILPPNYAIHFDNTKLKEVGFERLKERYPNKFKSFEGTVEYMKNIDNGVEVKINNSIHVYDYVVDCGGFPKDYTGYTMVDLPINHALVAAVHKEGDWNYTHHWAHRNGWMFGIPLQHRQGWGYLYNDTITSKEDALADMASIIKVPKEDIKFREYTFKPYHASENLIDGRILKNGNRYMFFEPMEALSMEYYVRLNVEYIKLINGETSRQKIINNTLFEVNGLISFYRYMYHGGSIYDTDFWRITKENTRNHLLADKQFLKMLAFYNDNAHRPDVSTAMTIQPFFAYTWEQFDKNLGYNYFKQVKKEITKPKVKIPGLLFG